MPKSDRRIVKSPIAARQGFLGRPVLVVLIVSSVFAALVMALVYVGVIGTG
jgi:hypothetical protein